ncbi:hypothetical protein [Chenggangzhangella methanolivorans]|uniref:Uncharacterized protein n=1 Tax=Chenggangzhangella methanolivorans TaxID=1437009 RepID=A0A9E6UP66_9HYPH|nr:hypothetical protein [Chenggangzhangella methanolivorans]QZO01951.1 hypothetical protein K6K41_11930 [Chenggangzhangella methanolivorans]
MDARGRRDDVPAGHRIGLIGPDSAKNSAVLKILSGVDDPDKGAIRRVGTTCWPLDYTNFIEPKATVNQNAKLPRTGLWSIRSR